MEEDPDFAEKLRMLVDEVQEEQNFARTTFDLRGQTVHGNQTNIDTVQGSVNIGDSMRDGKQ